MRRTRAPLSRPGLGHSVAWDSLREEIEEEFASYTEREPEVDAALEWLRAHLREYIRLYMREYRKVNKLTSAQREAKRAYDKAHAKARPKRSREYRRVHG